MGNMYAPWDDEYYIPDPPAPVTVVVQKCISGEAEPDYEIIEDE